MNVDRIEIAKLELQPGDILLVRIPENLNPAHVDGAVKQAMKEAGVNVSVLIGPKNVDFQIVRKAELINMTECSDVVTRA